MIVTRTINLSVILIAMCFCFGMFDYYRITFLEASIYAAILVDYLFLVFLFIFFRIRIKKNEWKIILLFPMVIYSIVIVSAFVFSENYNVSFVSSLLAQRLFILYLIAPIFLMSIIIGVKEEDILIIFLAACFLSTIAYLLAFYLVDAESWSRSDDLYKRSAVAYDEWRGYRVKGPRWLIVFLFFISFALCWNKYFVGIKKMVLIFFGFFLSTLLLILTMPRTNVASFIIAGFIYWFILRKKNIYAYIIMMLSPAFILLISTDIVYSFNGSFNDDFSYIIRLQSYSIAWDAFLQNPLFGVGQASYYTISYQDIFGDTFHPYDIGIIGMLFQYGIIGGAVYLYFNFKIFHSGFRRTFNISTIKGTIEVVLYIFFIASVISLPIQALLIRGEGILFSCLWFLILSGEKRKIEKMRTYAS